jgi:hypothetical protein
MFIVIITALVIRTGPFDLISHHRHNSFGLLNTYRNTYSKDTVLITFLTLKSYETFCFLSVAPIQKKLFY